MCRNSSTASSVALVVALLPLACAKLDEGDAPRVASRIEASEGAEAPEPSCVPTPDSPRPLPEPGPALVCDDDSVETVALPAETSDCRDVAPDTRRACRAMVSAYRSARAELRRADARLEAEDVAASLESARRAAGLAVDDPRVLRDVARVEQRARTWCGERFPRRDSLAEAEAVIAQSADAEMPTRSGERLLSLCAPVLEANRPRRLVDDALSRPMDLELRRALLADAAQLARFDGRYADAEDALRRLTCATEDPAVRVEYADALWRSADRIGSADPDEVIRRYRRSLELVSSVDWDALDDFEAPARWEDREASLEEIAAARERPPRVDAVAPISDAHRREYADVDALCRALAATEVEEPSLRRCVVLSERALGDIALAHVLYERDAQDPHDPGAGPIRAHVLAERGPSGWRWRATLGYDTEARGRVGYVRNITAYERSTGSGSAPDVAIFVWETGEALPMSCDWRGRAQVVMLACRRATGDLACVTTTLRHAPYHELGAIPRPVVNTGCDPATMPPSLTIFEAPREARWTDGALRLVRTDGEGVTCVHWPERP